MHYPNRRWIMHEIDTSLNLALLLKREPWATETGFKIGDYLFLNDSRDEWGGQLYAVVHQEPDHASREIDLIELQYMDVDDLSDLLEAILRGEYDRATWATALPTIQVENGKAAVA